MDWKLHKNDSLNSFQLKVYEIVWIIDEKIMFSYDKADYVTNFNIKVPKNSFGVHYGEGYYACEYEII